MAAGSGEGSEQGGEQSGLAGGGDLGDGPAGELDFQIGDGFQTWTGELPEEELLAGPS